MLSQGVFDFGESVGSANVVKLAGNFLIMSAFEAMAEASALAEKNGVPRAALLNMFTHTLFACPIYQNYSKRLIDADFDQVGFALPLVLKDMNLGLQTAGASNVPMPALNILRDRCLASVAKGRARWTRRPSRWTWRSLRDSSGSRVRRDVNEPLRKCLGNEV